jgi:hypothetical protein
LYIIWVCISYLCEGGQFSCFPVVMANIFGLTNGGIITTLAFIAVPVSSISSFLLVYFDFEPTNIYIVGAVLTFINLCILIVFDESEMKRIPNSTRLLPEYGMDSSMIMINET